jgi:hypothetical protein
MALWDRVKDGIEKANRVANEAIDEGKTRMDARKARQAADQAAESLGYAVFRAWQAGKSLDEQSLERLARALRDHEQEAVRLEAAAQEAAEWRRRTGAAEPTTPPMDAPAAGPTDSAPGPEAPPAAPPAN